MAASQILLVTLAACIAVSLCSELVLASGTKLFVVPDSRVGSKADCSEDFPCSLKHALAIATSGAELNLDVGRYAGNLIIHANQTGLSLSGGGASESVVESAGLLDDAQNEIVLDVRASGVSINQVGFVHSREAGNATNQIGVLIRDTAANATFDEVLVLLNASNSKSNSRGVVVHGAPKVELKKTMVVGPWEDGIHLISSSSKIKQGLVDGATRIGIAVINTNASASSANKIKQVAVRNIGDGSIGTAIEIQGIENHVKEGDISNWGKYGIHVCGNAGPDKCDPCHYSRTVEELPETDPLKTATHTSIKGVTFSGAGEVQICDGGEETQVKSVHVVLDTIKAFLGSSGLKEAN